MVAGKPQDLSDVEAASVPVVAVTAWQMHFEYAYVTSGQPSPISNPVSLYSPN